MNKYCEDNMLGDDLEVDPSQINNSYLMDSDRTSSEPIPEVEVKPKNTKKQPMARVKAEKSNHLKAETLQEQAL